MKKENLEEYLEKISENTDFTFDITGINDKEVEIEIVVVLLCLLSFYLPWWPTDMNNRRLEALRCREYFRN